jgi:DNA repair protein RAD51
MQQKKKKQVVEEEEPVEAVADDQDSQMEEFDGPTPIMKLQE